MVTAAQRLKQSWADYINNFFIK